MAICHALHRSWWLAALEGDLEDGPRYSPAVDDVVEYFQIGNLILTA